MAPDLTPVLGFFLGALIGALVGVPYWLWLVSGRGVKAHWSARVVMAVSLTVAQIDLVAIGLAYAVQLTSFWWIGINLALSAAGTIWLVRRNGPQALEWHRLAVAKRGSRRLAADLRRWWWLGLMAGVVVTIAGYRAVLVPELATDALEYQGLQTVTLLANRSFPSAANAEAPHHVECYPFLGNLHKAWWVQFPGGLELTIVGSYAGYLFGALTVYALCRRFASPRSHAVVATCCYLATPVVYALGTSGYVDLQAAVPVLAAVVLLPRRRSDFVLCSSVAGLLIGMAYGTRPNLLAAAPLVFALHVTHGLLLSREALLKTAGVKQHWPARAIAMRVGGPLVLFSLLIGGHAYVRNWIHHANPVYPNTLDVGPIHFDGPHTPETNAAGSLYGHLDSSFPRMPQWRQVWSLLRDENRFSSHVSLWEVFSPSFWGNVMLWGLIPATVFSLAWSRHRANTLACLLVAVAFIAALPFARALPRFHLVSGLLLFPSLAAAATAVDRRGRGWFTQGWAATAVVFLVAPNLIASLATNYVLHYSESYRDNLHDWYAVKATDACLVALAHREGTDRVLIGPHLPPRWIEKQYLYTYQRRSPVQSPVLWRVAEPFNGVRPAIDRGDVDLILCGAGTDWADALDADDRCALLWRTDATRLYRRMDAQ